METRRHSGLGIASLVISLVAGIVVIVLVITAGVMEATTPGGVDENAPEVAVMGLMLLGGAGAALLSLCLGICGLAQQQRNKLFAWLGTAFSAALLLGLGLIIAGGLVMESMGK